MEETIIYMMDSEFCCECGTALNQFESTLCYDCQQDQRFDEDQDYYDGWFSDWDIPIEKANKP